MLQVWNDLKSILTAPLNNKLDIVHLFLLIGLVLVMIAIWLMILQHAKEAALDAI